MDAGLGYLRFVSRSGKKGVWRSGGISVHRIDLDCVAKPDRPFNNFGGGNFWRAQEGGRLGFNYCGSEWYVQECINKQQFEVVSHDAESAVISKRIVLLNRAGTVVETIMRWELRISPSLPVFFSKGEQGSGLSCLSNHRLP